MKFTFKQIYFGLFLLLSVVLLLLHDRRQGADEIHYLAWAHSIFFDNDIFLLNQFESLRVAYFFTPTGYVAELRNFGTALFWFPAYGLFFVFTLIHPHLASSSEIVDQPTLLLIVNWGTFIYIFLSIYITSQVLLSLFPTKVTWLSVATVLLGTPLIFYTVQRPLSSHPISVLLASLYLLLLHKKPYNLLRYFIIGVLCGWLMLVATYNVALLLAPLAIICFLYWDERHWQKFFLRGLNLFAGTILGFLPQLLIWQAFYKNILASPYSQQIDWLNPQILPTLFSTFHGVFIYAPVLLLTPLGLIVVYQKIDKKLAVSLALVCVGFTYTVSSNLAWWAGASFGNRYFLTLSPFFMLMIAALLHYSLRWLWVIVPCIIWSVGLWLQTLDGTLQIGDANFYTLQNLFRNQALAWQNIPYLIEASVDHWLFTTPPLLVILILFLSIVIYVLTWYATILTAKLNVSIASWLFGISATIVILFTLILFYRSEPLKVAIPEDRNLSTNDTYRVSIYDPIDLSKTYLDRAAYYEFIGHPERVLPDLQKATQVWFSDSRKILDYSQLLPSDYNQIIPLKYGPDVQLIGYSWNITNRNRGQLTLYWQKIASGTEKTYTPTVSIFNDQAEVVWTGKSRDPFPARYIPQDYIFYDSLDIRVQELNEHLWLKVDFPNYNVSPQTNSGVKHSGVINLVDIKLKDEIGLSDKKNVSSSIKVESLSPVYTPAEHVGLYLLWLNSGKQPSFIDAELHLFDQNNNLIWRNSVDLLTNSTYKSTPAPANFLSSTLCFYIPPALAEGDYQLHLAMYQSQNVYQVIPVLNFTVDTQTNNHSPVKTICNLINSNQPDRLYKPQLREVDNISTFGEAISLLDYDMTLLLNENGLQAEFRFEWLALKNNPTEIKPRLRLANSDNKIELEYSWVPKSGHHPPKYWFNNELVIDEVQVQIEKLPAGEYKVLLDWQNLSNENSLTTNSSDNYVVLDRISR